jgi:hypothetical protein
VLVLGALRAIRAAKQTNETIRIVIVTTQNQVATRIIERYLAGNITGLTYPQLRARSAESWADGIEKLCPGLAMANAIFYSIAVTSSWTSVLPRSSEVFMV